MLRRLDLSLVGGRLRLTTPIGSPSDELFDSDPQSVTDSGDATVRLRSSPTPGVRDAVEGFDPRSGISSPMAPTRDSSDMRAEASAASRTRQLESSVSISLLPGVGSLPVRLIPAWRVLSASSSHASTGSVSDTVLRCTASTGCMAAGCFAALAGGEAVLATPPAGLTSAAELDAAAAGGESCCVDVGALAALTDSSVAASPACPADRKWSISLFVSGGWPEGGEQDAPAGAAVEGPEVVEEAQLDEDGEEETGPGESARPAWTCSVRPSCC